MQVNTQKTNIAHSAITKKFLFKGHEIVFEKGKMGMTYDTNGQPYVDFVMGYGPVILGHAYPDFQTKLIAYLENGIMMPAYTAFHEEYLTRLLDGRSGQRGAFFKTASEAVTAAFRIVGMETHKLGIIRCGFVGWHDAQIGRSVKWHEPLHSPLRNKTKYNDFMRGIGPDEPVFNWLDMKLDTLKEIVVQHKSKIGGFIIDAYLVSFIDLDTMQQVIELCHDNDLLVIFDETKTGGRISKHGYAFDNKLNVDLTVIGKSLANGAPLSVLVGREHLLGYAEKARLSGTFSKDMLAIYSALATLEILEKGSDSFDTGWAEVGWVGTKVAEVICAASEEADLREHLWAQPVLGGGMFELCYSDTVLPQGKLRKSLLRYLTEAGIIMLEGHPSFVCLAHRELNWDQLRDRFKQAFNQWKNIMTEAPHAK